MVLFVNQKQRLETCKNNGSSLRLTLISMSYRDKKYWIFFSGAVFDEEIRFERSGRFSGHEHGKSLMWVEGRPCFYAFFHDLLWYSFVRSGLITMCFQGSGIRNSTWSMLPVFDWDEGWWTCLQAVEPSNNKMTSEILSDIDFFILLATDTHRLTQTSRHQ